MHREIWEVVPFVPLAPHGQQTFSYAASDTENAVAPGVMVRVPFGSRNVRGLVVRPGCVPRGARLKPITSAVSSTPLFTAAELGTLRDLAALSLESFALLVKSASLVREPLIRGRVGDGGRTETPTGEKGRSRGFRVDVVWENIAAALPDAVKAPVLVLTPETVVAHEALDILRRRKVPSAFFAQSLRTSERRNVLHRLRRGEPLAVVATHAGIFLPFPRLTRIIVLEAALASHRQWDLHPRYDARIAARLLAEHHGVPLAVQSSLPSLDLALLAGKRDSPLLVRPWQVLPRAPADPLLSLEIIATVRETVARGGTVLCFHDLVGGERVFTCDSCGTVLRCPACGGMLEREGRTLRCRSCGDPQGPVPHFCPRCRSPHVGARRVGTARIVDDLQAALPGTHIIRVDRETLPRTRAGETPPLLGRSVIVGTERAFAAIGTRYFDRIVVISADRLLEEPRYDAAEQWVTLLARLSLRQAAESRVPLVVQTTHAGLAVVRALREGTILRWAEEELADRAHLSYPPCAALLALARRFRTRAHAARAAARLRERLPESAGLLRVGFRVAGTAQQPRAEVLLRGSLPALRAVARRLPGGWRTDPHLPLSLLAGDQETSSGRTSTARVG